MRRTSPAVRCPPAAASSRPKCSSNVSGCSSDPCSETYLAAVSPSGERGSLRSACTATSWGARKFGDRNRRSNQALLVTADHTPGILHNKCAVLLPTSCKDCHCWCALTKLNHIPHFAQPEHHGTAIGSKPIEWIRSFLTKNKKIKVEAGAADDVEASNPAQTGTQASGESNRWCAEACYEEVGKSADPSPACVS